MQVMLVTTHRITAVARAPVCPKESLHFGLSEVSAQGCWMILKERLKYRSYTNSVRMIHLYYVLIHTTPEYIRVCGLSVYVYPKGVPCHLFT